MPLDPLVGVLRVHLFISGYFEVEAKSTSQFFGPFFGLLHTCQPMGGLMQDNIHNFAGHFNGFAGQIMKVIILVYLLIIKIITCNIVQASEYTISCIISFPMKKPLCRTFGTRK